MVIIVAVFSLSVGIFFYVKSLNYVKAIEKREKEMSRKMYELSILKEIGDRVGYSLDVRKIVEIISGSLHQFIEYGAVSYILIESEKLVFNCHVEKPIHRKFVDDVRTRMIGSLSALLDKDFSKIPIEEVLSGVIFVEDKEEPVRSFFNIPIVIGDKAVGVLTVADTKIGLYREEEMTILYKITQMASKAVSRLQDVVRTEEHKLNAMVESITEGVVMTDSDFRIAVSNPAALRAVGLEAKNSPTIFDFMNNLKGKFDIKEKLEESIKLDKQTEMADVLLGDKFYKIVVSPVKSSSGLMAGEILGGVVIFLDTTKEKELEELRKDFVSMVVHELRSPIDGIKKIAELVIQRKPVLSGEKIAEEYAPIIFRSASEMLLLVNNLLDAAKVESGKYEVNPVENNIRDLVNERISFYSPMALSSQMKVEAVFSENLPEKSFFDRNSVGEVLNNFISNAIKFNRKDKSIYVQAVFHRLGDDITKEMMAGNNSSWFIGEVEAKQIDTIGDSLVLAITDGGEGIKKEEQQQLFNKFRQFKRAALSGEVKKGTGLGLYISKGIAEAHRGVVGVASKEGMGSTFFIAIPQKKI